MTKEEFISGIGSMKNRIDIDGVYKIVDELDGLEKDDLLSRIVSYSSILKSGRYKVEDYVKAIHFCSLVGIGCNRTDAYRKTFPDRVVRKNTASTIQSSASIYASGELVQKIMAQSMIPAHYMFQAERIKAIGVLADLMINAGSEKVQMESADKLLNHIEPPKEAKLEIDVKHSNDGIEDLNNALNKLAMKQKEMLDTNRIGLKEIAEGSIIDVEVKDV